MIDSQQVDQICRLHYGEQWSLRRIARHLGLSRQTVLKYLRQPAPAPVERSRPSKLDPYKELIATLLQADPEATAVVITQRLRPQGYSGGLTILKEYLREVRPRPRRAFVRVQTRPGERFEVDWGHFGVLDYEGDPRKLYAFVCVETYSRRLYVEFTHSQRFETFVRSHQHAFDFMGGVSREILYDNLATAVAERDGRLVRFQPRFWAFAREYGFCPRACNPRSAWEKGTCERAIRYLRQNFWPLRTFRDLTDINSQARQWQQEVANQRRHAETRQLPEQRFRPDSLRPLPANHPDYRDTESVRVHKDLRLRFDGNRYCVPARFVGRRLLLKADSQSVTLYHRHREIVRYPRCWRRGQTLGAERFEKELLESRPAARRSQAQQRLLDLLGEMAETYLRHLANTDRSLSRQITELLQLVREYGPEAVKAALTKAQRAQAFGAEYVANLLLQDATSRHPQPPLRLKDPRLNELTTDPVSLEDYDQLIPLRRKKS